MTFDEWITSKRLTEDAAALHIGISQTAVHRYRRRVRIPRPEIIMLIKEKTEGQVGEADWFADKKLSTRGGKLTISNARKRRKQVESNGTA